jgi:L-ascorbate metabolism protein UlaG (beta-lactamase superfamily)
MGATYFRRRRASADRGPGLRLTYIGGPTALLELGGLRFLTDPTFDPGGSEYPTRQYVLRKTQGPALAPDAIGAVDVVLLSHDHHFDNLDHAGRAMLTRAARVLTTAAGAERLGGNAIGLTTWQTHEISTPDGRVLRITATPTRHGPPGGDRGPVIGFMLAWVDEPAGIVYVSGDTVWFDGVAEVARRFSPGVAVLFAGAARVPEVGPAHLTLTADEAVTVARAVPDAVIVPLHFEGWAHFSESRAHLERAFSAAALAARLRLPIAGHPLDLSPG